MIVLGIDPGSLITGFGVIEKRRSDLAYVKHGEIKMPVRETLPAFLVMIYERLMAVIEETRPDAMAIEEIFFGKNVKSLIRQGQARGVAILAGSHSGLAVFEYSALEVKKAVVGYGRAEKSQVQIMVKAILSLSEPPPADAADALAVAICHANSAGRAGC
ncbi:MAG: crossover junction endodeoxyribonuclease RuvC [Syntrophales bacterium]|nr:crossover junction endodeoxyribonuclease RuvC [Syntrophales bacterium]